MKRLLSIIGAITLVGTSTTSLVACNTTQEYTPEELEHLKKENQINTADENIKNNLEWIAPQEKPFNNIDNKWYYVVWRGDENDNWRLIKFKNDSYENERIIDKYNNIELHIMSSKTLIDAGLLINTKSEWGFKKIKRWIEDKKNDYFKYIYRWNLDTNIFDLLDIDENGNIKVK